MTNETLITQEGLQKLKDGYNNKVLDKNFQIGRAHV